MPSNLIVHRLLVYACLALAVSACTTGWKDKNGKSRNLPNIHFEPGSVDLDLEARSALQDIALLVNAAAVANHPVVVSGHSDTLGPEALNLDLSRKRADAVAQELIFNGVHWERVRVLAYGEEQPLAVDVREDGTVDPDSARINRRVEIALENR